MPELHAVLSASSASRWLNCPPSVRLSEGLSDKGSEFAAEGTAAHSLAEQLIQGHLTGWLTVVELENVRRSEYYGAEMETCIQNYAEWVMELFEGIKRDCPDAELLTEVQVDFSKWVPAGFGTSDVVILADDTMYVIDLKYGKGVPVSAIYNPQLRLYALGAYEAFNMEYDIRRIKMIINQPRLDSVSEDEIEAERLLAWAEEFVKPRAELAYKGEGEITPGDHCRFCKAKALCRQRMQEAKDLEERFKNENPELLSDKEIGEVLALADRISAWVKDVTGYALEQAKEGAHFDGYKLVEGRSVRKISDPEKVVEILTAEGFDRAMLYKAPELNGITALSSIVGKKKLETLIKDYIVKPQGALTLVPESDKRPAVGGAEAFNDGYKEN